MARRGGRTASVKNAPPFFVEVFGSFSATYGGRIVIINSQKARALVAYLLLSDVVHETRERLVGLLWSEAPEDKARASLRQVIHELREAFQDVGCPYFKADRSCVAIERARSDSDLNALIRCADVGVIDDRLLGTDQIADTLLSGFEDVDPAFRIWLLARRRTSADRLTRVLEGQIRSGSRGSTAGMRSAEALLRLDGTHEEACRYLMRCHADRGDQGGALRVYKRLWDLLESEYDIEPSQLTQNLLVEIRQGAQSVEPSATQPRIAAERSAAGIAPTNVITSVARASDAPQPSRSGAKIVIGLEPFDMTAIEATKSYLVQGFRHELAASLVRFREWLVRDQAGRAEPRQEAQTSSCEYIVSGRAFPASDSIRLILTLRSADEDQYVWSDRVEVSLENWFDAQQTIVRRIATALNVHLSAERLSRLAPEPDAALQVYDRWLRGQALINRVTPLAWQRASEVFREIIAEVPEFAPAYSSLVQLNNSLHIVHPGVFRDRDRQNQTLTLARAAAALDPIDSRVQLCLGWSHAMSGLYGPAEINLGLAVDLNENDPWTLISAAHCFAFCGNMGRAEDLARQARVLSGAPGRIHWGFQVGIRFLYGDYHGCIEAANNANDIIPNLPGWKAAALVHAGHMTDARAEARRFTEMTRSRWFGSTPATDDAIGRWFMHLFPINRHEDWTRLRRGLAGAGLPVNDVEHGSW